MFARLILLCTIYLYQYVSCDNIKIEFIKDYISKQDERAGVNIFSCWSLDSRVKLLNSIFINNVHATYTNLDKFEIDIKPSNKAFFILDLSCNHSLDILKLANKKYLFKRPYNWLLLSNGNSQNKPATLLVELDVFLDSRVIYAENVDGYKYVSSYIYKIGKDSDCIIHKLASWEYEKGFVFYDKEILTRKRTNLNGYAVSSANVFLSNESYKDIYNYRQNEIDTVSKVGYMLTTYIIDYLNATHNALFPSSWDVYNGENENDTMYGMLRNNIADISGSYWRFTKERLAHTDYVMSPVVGQIPFIFRQPPLSYVKNIYILPFDSMLWLTYLFFLLFSSILLYIIVLWEWKINDEKHVEPEIDMIHAAVSDAVLFTIGGVSQQGYATEPKGVPGKILMLTLFFTLIFLFTAYSAYVVVLFQSTADNIKTVEDLYYSKIELGIMDQPYMKTFFEIYSDGIKAKIYREKIAPPGKKLKSYSLQDGVEKIRTEYFAFCVAEVFAYKLIENIFLDHEKCGLEKIKYFADFDFWAATSKKMPLLKYFKIGYEKLAEAGLVDGERKRRIYKISECLSQGNNYRSVGLIDLFSVYILFFIGLATSIIIFIIERISHRFLTCNRIV